MKETYTPVVLSSEEVELIYLLRSLSDKDSKSTTIELLRQFSQMDWSSRFRAIRSVMDIKDEYDREQKITLAIEYGRRHTKQVTPKAQFGDLKIYISK